MEQLFYDIGEWLRSVGPWAYVVAPLVMAAVAILPIPAEAPAMVNGALFGPTIGIGVTWVGSMLGAIISFELARRLGRPFAQRIVRPAALDRVDRLVMGAGWGGLLLARFMPLIAFTVLNWGAGLTPVGRGRFLWTTAVGILPGVIVFTASGWGITSLLAQRTWIGLGVAATVVAWLVWRRRQTKRRARSEGAEPPTEPSGG